MNFFLTVDSRLADRDEDVNRLREIAVDGIHQAS